MLQKKYYSKALMILQRNDFLNLSLTSLKEHYQVTERSRVPKEKNYNAKSYHKSEKKIEARSFIKNLKIVKN